MEKNPLYGNVYFFSACIFFTLHTYQMEFFAISSFAILEEITSGLGNNDFDEAEKPERRKRYLWVLFMVPTLET